MTEPLTLDALEEFPAPNPHASSDSPLTKLRNKVASDTSTTKPRERKSVPASRPGEFVEPITSAYTMLAVALMPFDEQCASVLIEEDKTELTLTDGTTIKGPNYGKTRAEICAIALDEAAQKSPSLRKVLRMLTTGGTWGAVVSAHLPIVYAVATHHTQIQDRIGAAVIRRMGGTAE